MLPVDTKVWAHRVPGYIPDSDHEDRDSEEEEFIETSEERLDAVLRTLGPRWISAPVVEFSPVPLQSRGPSAPVFNPPVTRTAYGTHKPTPPNFRIERVHAPIVSKTLYGNGMLPTSGKDWAIQWSGPLRDSGYQSLAEFQRVNHFPGSTELTRKDRLWRHFNEMKQAFGAENFDFVPESYVIPDQVEQFLDCYERTKCTWIVKPNASSQGRGIFLLNDLEDLPLEECSVVSRYVDNPLLIQGLKFDLRIYVLVTSYTPLRAYVYREGLTRFASSPYTMDPSCLNDAYRHLTNYSVNKTAVNFVENQEEESDNYGHKWSLSALNRHLECVGVNVNLMWARIMDLIVKTLLSVEPSIAAKTRGLQVQNNCFEIYGFDVLVDEELKPWLLEVNLSPSMKADSPLDWKVKSNLLADAFNIVGIASPDRNAVAASKLRARIQQVRQATISQAESQATNFARRHSKDEVPAKEEPAAPGKRVPVSRRPVDLNRLTDDQLKLLAVALEETKRCRNFIRLHPTKNSSDRYSVICDFRGPRGLEFGQSFRMTQATWARLLASVMFGPNPIGPAVAERRLPRTSQILTGREEDNSESKESRELCDPKQQTLSSLDSGTTKASEGTCSDVEISEGWHSEGSSKSADSTEDMLRKRKRHAFLEVSSPGATSSGSSSPGLSRPGSNSESQRPATVERQGFLPPSVQRPLMLGLENARAAARAAMQIQSVPRCEAPLRLSDRSCLPRSKSTPVLPRLNPEALQSQRPRQSSSWMQAESLSFHHQLPWDPVPSTAPAGVALVLTPAGKRRGQQATLALEALNDVPNVDIEL